MALTSVPPNPPKRWWTKLARVPAWLWSLSGELATLFTEGDHRQPSKRKLALIRIPVMVSLILFSPLAVVLRSRLRRQTAFDVLHTRVRGIWQTSSNDAIALLRSAFEQLVAGGAFAKMKSVEIPPFGKFWWGEALSVHGFLYDCELTLGNYEEALAVAGALPGRTDVTILRQVDCLLALGRHDQALALLEGNLDLDGWRGKLRRRLLELGGRHLRALD